MVTAVVYDIRGRQIASLMEKMCPAGKLLLSWNGKNNDGESLGNGIYFAVIKVGSHQLVQRMVRIRLEL